MLAIFNKHLVNPPQELNSSASLSSSSKKQVDILKDFQSSDHPSSNSFSISFTNAALLAYSRPPQNSYSISAQRFFCGVDEICCVFMGGLNNLCSLLKQYGLSNSNEAMFIIEAYRTLRDRGPYPAHQVLRDLEGSFGFVIYDNKAGHVFAALGQNEQQGQGVTDSVRLYWGIAADGSVVISDRLEVVQGSCAKSYAPFPNGCMFHSELGLVSFQHPTSQMKPMARIDSEGILCGANFKADSAHSTTTMQRVGSGANWALWGSNAN